MPFANLIFIPEHRKRAFFLAAILVAMSITAAISLTRWNSTRVSARAAAAQKPHIFADVAINKSGSRFHVMSGALATEYFSTGLPIRNMIVQAYFPPEYRSKDSRVIGAPAWVTSERYDVAAKLRDNTVAEWAQTSPLERQEKIRPMLQTLLAERFSLAVHLIPDEVQGYALVVAKDGPKLSKAASEALLPDVPMTPIPGGGMMTLRTSENRELRFFGASMASLATQLSLLSDSIVQDRTGLGGSYDFAMRKLNMSNLAVIDGRTLSPWAMGELGLELKPVKVHVNAVVVDHIDRPIESD